MLGRFDQTRKIAFLCVVAGSAALYIRRERMPVTPEYRGADMKGENSP